VASSCSVDKAVGRHRAGLCGTPLLIATWTTAGGAFLWLGWSVYAIHRVSNIVGVMLLLVVWYMVMRRLCQRLRRLERTEAALRESELSAWRSFTGKRFMKAAMSKALVPHT